jgi:nucleosome binding factor SPN SPT16 subunit
VLLQPTKSCLINITEPHFFVFCIDDIEVVWFERMTGNVRYFDLTVVHKDYERYVRINSISIKDVEKVKDWLDSNNIIFYDNKISVNWNKFLQGVRVDFKKFVEDGAWTAWDEEDGEGDGQISDDDSEFSAESEELVEESEDSEESESDYEK